MANTLIIYKGDGATTEYIIPFDYLKKTFVKVILDTRELQGGNQSDPSAEYYFLDARTIKLKTAPPSGTQLTIRRFTSESERVVSFNDGSVFKAKDLDVSQVQAFHIASEARDIINDALIQDSEDNWDAHGHRIVNVGDPVNPQDAVTKKHLDTQLENIKATNEDLQKFHKEALEAKARAVEAETNAKTSEVNSKQSEVRAGASAGTAVSASKTTELARQEVDTNLKEARVLNKETVDNASIAKNSADKAKVSEVNSKASETNAKESELRAKSSEDMVTELAGIVAESSAEIKIVSDNIDHVITDAVNITDIKTVSSDLNGLMVRSKRVDYGTLDDTTPETTIVGGNIKKVADNIASVKIDADNIKAIITVADHINNLPSINQQFDAKVAEATRQATLAKEYADTAGLTLTNVQVEGNKFIESIKTEGNTQVGRVTAEGNKQVTRVTQEGTTQVNNVIRQGETQVNLAKAQVTLATQQAELATTKANEADDSATMATQKATEAQTSATNSANSAKTSTEQSTIATTQAGLAKANADEAKLARDASTTSERNAKTSETNAKASENKAKEYAQQAKGVQADWNQSDSSQLDYIKNKPTDLVRHGRIDYGILQ